MIKAVVTEITTETVSVSITVSPDLLVGQRVNVDETLQALRQLVTTLAQSLSKTYRTPELASLLIDNLRINLAGAGLENLISQFEYKNDANFTETQVKLLTQINEKLRSNIGKADDFSNTQNLRSGPIGDFINSLPIDEE